MPRIMTCGIGTWLCHVSGLTEDVMNEKIAGLAGDCKFSVSIVSSLMPSETFLLIHMFYYIDVNATLIHTSLSYS